MPRPRLWPATPRLVRHASAKGVPHDTSTCPTRLGRRLGPTRATSPTPQGVSDEDSGGLCWLSVHAHREPNGPLLFANTFPSNSPQVLVALWVHELGDPCFHWLVRKPEHALRQEAEGSEIGDSGDGSLERGSGSVEAVARRHVTQPLPLGAPSSQPEPTGAL